VDQEVAEVFALQESHASNCLQGPYSEVTRSVLGTLQPGLQDNSPDRWCILLARLTSDKRNGVPWLVRDYLARMQTRLDFLLSTEELTGAAPQNLGAAAPNSGKRELAYWDSVRGTKELAGRVGLQSIKYSGLKIFVLGHEASHVVLDPYSEDLEAEKGYQKGAGDGCASMFFLETRADVIGLSTLLSSPSAGKIGELGGIVFSDSEIEKMGDAAIDTGFRALFAVMEKEEKTEPKTSSFCVLSAEQRRSQLDEQVWRWRSRKSCGDQNPEGCTEFAKSVGHLCSKANKACQQRVSCLEGLARGFQSMHDTCQLSGESSSACQLARQNNRGVTGDSCDQNTAKQPNEAHVW